MFSPREESMFKMQRAATLEFGDHRGIQLATVCCRSKEGGVEPVTRGLDLFVSNPLGDPEGLLSPQEGKATHEPFLGSRHYRKLILSSDTEILSTLSNCSGSVKGSGECWALTFLEILSDHQSCQGDKLFMMLLVIQVSLAWEVQGCMKIRHAGEECLLSILRSSEKFRHSSS